MSEESEQQRLAFNRAVNRNLWRIVSGDGRSVREIERDCGVGQNTVGKMTNGAGMHLITAVRLCDGLGCSIEELVGDAGGLLHARDGR